MLARAVAIPRVTYTQAAAGTPISVRDARSGDLVLIPGSDGTAAPPGHVGMVAGWLTELGERELDRAVPRRAAGKRQPIRARCQAGRSAATFAPRPVCAGSRAGCRDR